MAARSFFRNLRSDPVYKRNSYVAAVTVAAFVFVWDNVVNVRGVRGDSMAPTLSPLYFETGWKDYVVFNRMVPPQLLRRNDIIDFRAPHNPEQCSIKRIVALPGDTVITRGRYPYKKVVVPWNHVWVEGDNWRRTVDSNDFGPLPMGLINGRAEYILLPLSRQGKIHDSGVEFKTYSKVNQAKTPARPPPEYDD